MSELDNNREEQQKPSALERGSDAVQAARDLKNAAEAAKTAKAAASTAKAASAAGGAAKAAGAVATGATTGGLIGAAVAVATQTKAGRAIIGGIIGIVIAACVVLAMLPGLSMGFLNQVANNFIDETVSFYNEVRDHAAVNSVSKTEMRLQMCKSAFVVAWSRLNQSVSDNMLDDGDNMVVETDAMVLYNEDAEIKSIEMKVEGTINRVEARTDELINGLKNNNSDDIWAMCVDQSPQYNWSSAPGDSEVTMTVIDPPEYEEGDALALVCAYSTQCAQQSGDIGIVDYLDWLGWQSQTFWNKLTGTAVPWKGTYVSQPVYEEIQARIEEVEKDPDLTKSEKKDKIQEIEDEYEEFYAALMNMLVLVEEPSITTWEETRVRIETRYKGKWKALRDEDGNLLRSVKEDGSLGGVLYEWDPYAIEYEVEIPYTVGMGNVTYSLRYLSTQEISEILGFWTNGTGSMSNRTNGNEVKSGTIGMYYGLQGTDLVGLSNEEYIETLGPIFTASYQNTGLFASVCLAQCILESGWPESSGVSALATQANNLFGIKSGTVYDATVWDGSQVVYMNTKEQRADGSYYTINAAFRKYDSIDDCVADRAALIIKSGIYDAVVAATTYEEACYALQACGYATSQTYAQKLISLIRTYNLDRFDDLEAEIVQTESVGGSTTFYFSSDILMVQPDLSYSGHVAPQTAMEKAATKRAMYFESGADLGGAILVAQCIRDNYDYNYTISTYSDVINECFSTFYWSSSTADMDDMSIVDMAYDYVFVQGNSAVQHKILCYASVPIEFTFNSTLYKVLRYSWGAPYDDAWFWCFDDNGHVNPNTQLGLTPDVDVEDVIEDTLEDLDAAVYSVYYKNFKDDEELLVEDTMFDAGHLISPYIAAAYYFYLEGLEAEDTEYENVRRMLVENNEAAANALIDVVGIDNINSYLEMEGFSATCLNKKLGEEGTANTTSVEDLGILLEGLYRNTLLSEDHNEILLDLMKDHDNTIMIPAGLQSDDEYANATGYGLNSVGDAAIIYGVYADYLLVVHASDVVDTVEAEDEICELSEAISDALKSATAGAVSTGIAKTGSAYFSKTFFSQYSYYFSEKFGFYKKDEIEDPLICLKNNLSYGRDSSYNLLYSWEAHGKTFERQVAYQDDYYNDMLMNASEYADITVSVATGGLTGLSFGFTLGQLAESEFASYGYTACGYRYWPYGYAQAWCCDFVYWCASQLGLVGSGQLFGSYTSWCPSAITQLANAGAQIYYPGDGTTPQSGDIIFWWSGGRPGRAGDTIGNSNICHIGIVTAGTPSSVTVVEGNCGSSNPSQSVLKKNTYNLTSRSWATSSGAQVYIFAIARPNYPSTSFSSSDRAMIQKALVQLLYNGASGGVSCDFNGYVNTPGKHEGIDFASGMGREIYAVNTGKIVSIVYGNSSSVSLINVYDEANNKTVCYMHCAPYSGLYIGQEINIGDYLGTEAARGTSAAHTHLEVLNGLAYGAQKSVNDWNLVNDDPYPYWATVLSQNFGGSG